MLQTDTHNVMSRSDAIFLQLSYLAMSTHADTSAWVLMKQAPFYGLLSLFSLILIRNVVQKF